jgi:hypothetical protein
MVATYTRVKVYARAIMTSDNQMAIACSLSPGDYAQRLRDFRPLFASSLRASRREPTRLHLTLDPSTAREEEVRDLLRREQECCPFFNFSVEATAAELRIQAEVPEGAEECLDDLERLASRVPGSFATPDPPALRSTDLLDITIRR